MSHSKAGSVLVLPYFIQISTVDILQNYGTEMPPSIHCGQGGFLYVHKSKPVNFDEKDNELVKKLHSLCIILPEITELCMQQILNLQGLLSIFARRPKIVTSTLGSLARLPK